MISIQLIKNIVIIIIAVFILFIILLSQNKNITQEKFDGEIYNHSTSKLLKTKEEPNLKDSLEKTKLLVHTEKNDGLDELSTTKADKQIQNIVIATNTVSKKQDGITKTTKKIKKDKVSIISKGEKEEKKDSPTITTKEPKKEEVFNYSILNDIIKANQKTYFYADNFKNSSDVAVGIYSITPYKEYHILKFQVKNNSTSYFFIGNVEIKRTSKLIICKKYFDSIVAKNKTLEGIILAPEFSKNDKVKFKLYESGNKNRAYEIIIKIP